MLKNRLLRKTIIKIVVGCLDPEIGYLKGFGHLEQTSKNQPSFGVYSLKLYLLLFIMMMARFRQMAYVCKLCLL